MVLNNTGTNIVPDESVELKWGRADSGWHKSVKEIYTSAKDNPYSRFYFQSDIAILRAVCDFHNKALMNMIEPNAAVFKAIMEQYNHLNLTIRGRVLSQLTVAPTNEVNISDASVEMLTDRIAGRIAIHPEGTE